MKLTKYGSDYVIIDEHNIKEIQTEEKIHLIKLKFHNPNKNLMDEIFNRFPKTNRFIISDNIRFYNSIFKTTNKKYYVENYKGIKFISFFRKNNKVVINFTKLSTIQKQFICKDCLPDLLNNIEVAIVDEELFKDKFDDFENWNGNLIII